LAGWLLLHSNVLRSGTPLFVAQGEVTDARNSPGRTGRVRERLPEPHPGGGLKDPPGKRLTGGHGANMIVVNWC